MSSGYIKRLAIVEPTAPDIACPTAGSLYSSNEIGLLSVIKRIESKRKKDQRKGEINFLSSMVGTTMGSGNLSIFDDK